MIDINRRLSGPRRTLWPVRRGGTRVGGRENTAANFLLAKRSREIFNDVVVIVGYTALRGSTNTTGRLVFGFLRGGIERTLKLAYSLRPRDDDTECLRETDYRARSVRRT